MKDYCIQTVPLVYRASDEDSDTFDAKLEMYDHFIDLWDAYKEINTVRMSDDVRIDCIILKLDHEAGCLYVSVRTTEE
jgi:hypothetical protein